MLKIIKENDKHIHSIYTLQCLYRLLKRTYTFIYFTPSDLDKLILTKLKKLKEEILNRSDTIKHDYPL